MERLEEIRKKHSAGHVTSFKYPMNVIADYNNDVRTLLSIIDRYELQAELFEKFKTERKEMIELMVSKGLISPDQYLEVVNQVLYRKGE